MRSAATSSFRNGLRSTGACSRGETSRLASCFGMRKPCKPLYSLVWKARSSCPSSPILVSTCLSPLRYGNMPRSISWRSLVLASNYNPDVLSCIANLSSDEVFTPPQLVNRILDILPTDLWSDKESTFLDPGCKSGVFLREIAKRLDKALETQIPNRPKRMNHIFKNQLFGLAITELTALLSRRSLYCSKTANGKYSVWEGFDNPNGNIRLLLV